jgi:hypothetical protein
MLGSSDRRSLAVDGYTFLNEIGGAQQHIVPEHHFEKLLARAALPHTRIQDIPYAAGSLTLAQGVPAPEVSRVLGHASVDTTCVLYAHVAPQTQLQALDTVERILSG